MRRPAASLSTWFSRSELTIDATDVATNMMAIVAAISVRVTDIMVIFLFQHSCSILAWVCLSHIRMPAAVSKGTTSFRSDQHGGTMSFVG